jgi:hypothetical protein
MKRSLIVILLISILLQGFLSTTAQAWENTSLAVGVLNANGSTEIYDNVIGSDGSIYTTGWFSGTCDFDITSGTYSRTEAGAYDVFISKYSSNGNFIWNRNIGGTGTEIAAAIGLDSSQNVYATGTFESAVDFDPTTGYDTRTSLGSSDIFITKLSTDGGYLWTKIIGSSGIEQVSSIEVDSSGNILISGLFIGTVDFDPSAAVNSMTSVTTSAWFLLKLDSAGNFSWVRQVGGADQNRVNVVRTNASGEIYFGGQYSGTVDFDPGAGVVNKTSNGSFDIFLLKLNATGGFIWVNSFGGVNDDYGRAISFDANSNVYLSGYFFSTVDLDPSAGVQNATAVGTSDGYVSKFDNAGNFIWSKTWGGSTDDIVNDSSIDSSGNIYIVGRFFGTTDLNPGVETASAVSSGSADGFVLKLNSAGAYVWSKSLGGAGAENIYSIDLDSSENVVAVGSYSGTVDFDFTSGVSNYVSQAFRNGFIFKLSPSGVTEPSGPKSNPTFTFVLGQGAIAKVSYRANFNVLVTSSVAGKVTFMANGKKISGCISQPITTSFACGFKSSIRGVVTISAILIPTASADYNNVSAGAITLLSAPRTGLR